MLEESLVDAIGKAANTLELVNTLQRSGAMSTGAAAQVLDQTETLQDWIIAIHTEVDRAIIVDTHDRSVVIY